MIKLQDNSKWPNTGVTEVPEGGGKDNIFKEIMDSYGISKLDENYKLSDSRSSMSPEHKIYEENDTKVLHN